MTKTIEEAARDFVANYYELEEYGDEVSDIEIDNSEECFIGGANYVLSLPLSQRLTDEERERIKAKHNACRIAQTECDCLDYEIAADMLEEIFGKELFGEGEG